MEASQLIESQHGSQLPFTADQHAGILRERTKAVLMVGNDLSRSFGDEIGIVQLTTEALRFSFDFGDLFVQTIECFLQVHLTRHLDSDGEAVCDQRQELV